MNQSDAVELKDFLQETGYEAELHENYSGRGMYGKTTTAVTTDANSHAMESLEEEMIDAGINLVFRMDNMGFDYIYY